MRLWSDGELLDWLERIDAVTRAAAGPAALTDRLYETIITREIRG